MRLPCVLAYLSAFGTLESQWFLLGNLGDADAWQYSVPTSGGDSTVMAKAGLVFPDIDPILRDRVRTRGWALCVGAGTSVPTFPSWNTLVERLPRDEAGRSEPHPVSIHDPSQSAAVGRTQDGGPR